MDSTITIESGFFFKVLQESLNISCTVFDKDNKIIYANFQKEISSRILTQNAVLAELFSLETKPQMPVMFGSDLGVNWIACFDKEETTYVLGPFLSLELSDRIAEETLNRYSISLHLKREIMEFLNSIPVVNYNSVIPYAIMLHYVLNNEKISNGDIEIFVKNDKEEKVTAPVKDRIRVWKAEQQLMHNIEEGNLDFKDSIDNARRYSYGVQISTGNPSRQMKNSLLTFTSLAARAAIRGGLTPEMAYTISDMYSQRIEKAEQIGELKLIGDQMYEEYISKVHELKKKTVYSLPIQTVADYIEMHLEDDLSLSTIAKLIGYSDYYLSRRFRKEVGSSINQYITEKKIEYARKLLLYSELTIAETAEKLNYASETYFSTVFKKVTGMSPAQYRSANRDKIVID